MDPQVSHGIRSFPKWPLTLSAGHYRVCRLKEMSKIGGTGEVYIPMAAKHMWIPTRNELALPVI